MQIKVTQGFYDIKTTSLKVNLCKRLGLDVGAQNTGPSAIEKTTVIFKRRHIEYDWE